MAWQRNMVMKMLHFYQGDIADYEGVSSVDMVVTLHACDTATDYALAKAVDWGAKVILSVPCCQHELNRQIKNDTLEPVLKYGILKERMSALITDGIRANLLESMGYETQILEFIDMEHTPKNLLIRAVKTGNKKKFEKYRRTYGKTACQSCIRQTFIFGGNRQYRKLRGDRMKKILCRLGILLIVFGAWSSRECLVAEQ